MRTSYTDQGINVACGHIDPLPGCSQIAVFHSAFVLPEYRNRGIGYEAHKERLNLARQLLYDFAICTVDDTNTYQIVNLERCGWVLRGTFKSNKTGHTVLIYGKSLA